MTDFNLQVSVLRPEDAMANFVVEAGDPFMHEIRKGQIVRARKTCQTHRGLGRQSINRRIRCFSMPTTTRIVTSRRIRFVSRAIST